MFINKPKKIIFSSDPVVIDIPKPAKNFIPKWYSKSERYHGGEPQYHSNLNTNKSVKTCVPFLDTLTTGYMFELSIDVVIKQELDGPNFASPLQPTPIDVRNPAQNPLIPIPLGCSPHHFIWKIPHCFKTPKGYSLLVTHPLNRFDLPFVTMSGIVDADNAIGKGNFPFFLKDGFEGIIHAGTPIAQTIPFKRDDWESVRDDSLNLEGEKRNFMAARTIKDGYYKLTSWHKKEYN